MSPIAVRATDLIGDVASIQAADGSWQITFSNDGIQLPAEIRKFWGFMLLMAERDRATSVHYHPWRSGANLSYIVEGFHRYELSPLPDEHAEAIIETARSLFTAPPTESLISRLIGQVPERAMCSTFSFEVCGWAVLWDAVCWSNGERAGVELYRVTPLEEVPPAGGIVPADPLAVQ